MFSTETNADEVSAALDKFSKKLEVDMQARLNRAGTFLEMEMKHKIDAGLKPANHPYTVEKKGSSVPLLDTGEMYSQIGHEVGKDYVEVGVYGSKARIAKVHEFGKIIDVTPKMRKYLHGQGLHLRPDTTQVRIPERSFMRSALRGNRNTIKDILKGK